LGQCITYGNQKPNAPIIELVRGLLDTEAAYYTARAESGFISLAANDYLATLIGNQDALNRTKNLDPATLRGRTQEALAEYVRRRSQHEPLVLMIEDLHWADPSSLEYLSAVTTSLQGSRGLLVATFRPGTNPPWPGAVRLGRIRLMPLRPDAMRSLLGELAAASVLSQKKLEQIAARAERNPFFLQELVRAELSTGEEVPGDVFDVLSARIDRLAVRDKHNLRTAAVIGREFSLDLLDEIANESREERVHVEHLTGLGFIEPTMAPRRYRFVHALTQEVTYQGMLGDERRQLHTVVATRLMARAKSTEEDCEEIAHHHLAGKSPAQALPLLLAATAKAIRSHTLEAAHGFLVEVMRLFEAEESTPERLTNCVEYLLQAFPIFHFLHKHQEYAELLERYAQQVEALNNPGLLGAFLGQRGHRLWVAARYTEAESLLMRAIPLCEKVQDPVSAAHACLMATWLYAFAGKCELGEQYGLRAFQYLEQAPVPIWQTYGNVGLLLCAAFRGRWAKARLYGERARDVGLAAQDDGMASFGGGFLAWSLYEMGDDDAAVKEAQAALSIAPTNYFKGWSGTFMAAAMARLGQEQSALENLEQAVGYAEQAGHISGFALVALLRGEARVYAGQFDQAQQEVKALRRLARTIPFPFVAAGALQVQAECALRTGHVQEAVKLFRRAELEFTAIDAVHRIAQARAGAERAEFGK
jgi:tetratricopeptide (TPR) repeat protein